MKSDGRGFTLLELLVSIFMLSIIGMALFHALGGALATYDTTTDRQAVLHSARFALARMARFAGETGAISEPASGVSVETLIVGERLLDRYNNASHSYDGDGDSFLDADNDADNLVDEDDTNPDPVEYVTYALDKSDAANWKLTEQLPDYGTATLGDSNTSTVLCEYVTEFACRRLGEDVVEIQLAVAQGDHKIHLATRVRARNL
jgi:prepilin-type N-terminal cleavage/methylation domain-containing protein